MSFEAEVYFRERERLGTRVAPPFGEHVLMKYSAYKQHYADCRTVPGTYDASSKTVEVIVPEGRMKPSGVRGERFHEYRFWYTRNGGQPCEMYLRAVKVENAERRFLKRCKEEGLTPCNEPQNAYFWSNRLRYH